MENPASNPNQPDTPFYPNMSPAPFLFAPVGRVVYYPIIPFPPLPNIPEAILRADAVRVQILSAQQKREVNSRNLVFAQRRVAEARLAFQEAKRALKQAEAEELKYTKEDTNLLEELARLNAQIRRIEDQTPQIKRPRVAAPASTPQKKAKTGDSSSAEAAQK